ncbi:MAG TPA: D-galactarate dehydratase, partial [Thermosynergistes sp.]|nr:D-galactarate dehydratase [Thermosynergistes sp.]
LSGVLRREQTLNQAADAISSVMERTINSRLTAAEALSHREFVLTKLYRSA